MASCSDGSISEDDVDVFASSLSTIFAIEPVTVVSDRSKKFTLRDIVVSIPDPTSSNWNLQADAIWRSALYLANHLPNVHGSAVLELGAGAGLPGLICARERCPKSVVLSDYPDQNVIATLQRNVEANKLSPTVEVIGHGWGDEASMKELLVATGGLGFNVIIGADILWMSDQHENLCKSLARVLRRHQDSFVHLVAGFHTGRWPIARFLTEALKHGLGLAVMREVPLSDGKSPRPWMVERVETYEERRNWLIEIKLNWWVAPDLHGAKHDALGFQV